MKVFLYTTTTNDKWEICYGSYLIVAVNLKEANGILKLKNGEVLVRCSEILLDEQQFITIQETIVE